jgi:tetratricopeptide (TPR) repeat protein
MARGDELRMHQTPTTSRLVFLAVVPFLTAVTLAQPLAADDLADQMAKMDALWARRATPEPVHDLIQVGSEALAQDPRSYGVTWRVGRAYWWVGHTAEDSAARMAACAEGMRYGEAAIHLVPDGIEGHFVYAMSVGEYAANIGVMQAISEGIGPKFERASLDVYALDRDYDDGTPIVALGRYYYMLPWPLRDLNKSRQYLEEARQRHPRALWGRVYLGQTYYALGQERAAKAELRAVLALDPLPDKQPEDAPARAAAMKQLTDWYGNTDD